MHSVERWILYLSLVLVMLVVAFATRAGWWRLGRDELGPALLVVGTGMIIYVGCTIAVAISTVIGTMLVTRGRADRSLGTWSFLALGWVTTVASVAFAVMVALR